jgi:hypothetical protein
MDPMSKKSSLLLLVALAAGGYYLARTNGIDSFDKLAKLLKAKPATDGASLPPVAERDDDFVRIATLDLGGFDEGRLDDEKTAELLARVVRQFDVVALQNVRPKSPRLMARLVDLANAEGAQYAHVLGPEVGPPGDLEQFAFLFDEASLEVDREVAYLVDDPDDLFACDPFAAPFRVRGPDEAAAFTFTLVNVRIDESRLAEEYALLAGLFRAVRNDGRDEDDVIVLGAMGVDTLAEGPPGDSARFAWGVSEAPAAAVASTVIDNLFFDARATGEFSGRAGLLDLLREFNLTRREVNNLAARAPAWAEFALVEGPGN